MKALVLRICLLEPLLATQPGTGEENSSVTYDFIPGSLLRGAAIRAHLGPARQQLNLHKDTDASRLFFRGGLKFLNAYPAHPISQQRALPTPRAWLIRKDDADKDNPQIFNYAATDPQHKEAMKSPKGHYFWRMEKGLESYSPGVQVTAHNASTERNHKRAGDSTVYRYDAIPAGEEFAAVVLAEDDTVLGSVQTWFEQGLHVLGGSHTAGYGRVKIIAQIVDGWQEYTEEGSSENQNIIITLLSDLILRTADGQVSADFDQGLAEALDLSEPVKHTIAFQQVHLVGGFNRKWGLPLPQEWALKAGSTFVYPADSLNLDAIRALAGQGLGERQAEGFGRLGVNVITAAQLQAPLADTFDRPQKPVGALSSTSQKLAEQMAGRVLRAQLDEALVKAINRIELSGAPEKNQLARVRVVAQRARIETRLELIQDHLKALTPTSKKQFVRCRVLEKIDGKGVHKTTLLDWIGTRASSKDIHVQLIMESQNLPVVAGVKARLTEDLRTEYTARLLDGVMRKATRQKKVEARK